MSSDSSSGTHRKSTRTPRCVATSCSASIIAASAALHVVGAAAVQPVALHARLELLGMAGDDVKVTVQDDRGPVGRTDLRGQDRHLVERVVLDVDLARLEPALDEAGGCAQAIGWTCRR